LRPNAPAPASATLMVDAIFERTSFRTVGLP
jgi:hypothetical protein